MIKKLLIVAIFFLTVGSAAAANPDDNMGNKYTVSDFTISEGYFSALLTNQNNGAVGDGTWEISTSPAANHKNVIASGTFKPFQDTFILDYPNDGTFDPQLNTGTTFYLLVYTNYPEHDNRVSKVKCINTEDNPDDNPV